MPFRRRANSISSWVSDGTVQLNVANSRVFGHEALNRCSLVCVYYCASVGILYIMCICVIFVLHVFKPPVYLFVCECRLRERRGDVYSFVPAGSLSWGSRADLYWGNNPGSGAPAQGGFHSFSLWNFRPHFSTLDDRMQKYDEANLWRRSTDILTYIYCRGWRVGNQFPNYTQTQSHISILLESQLVLYFAASVLSATNYFSLLPEILTCSLKLLSGYLITFLQISPKTWVSKPTVALKDPYLF